MKTHRALAVAAAALLAPTLAVAQKAEPTRTPTRDANKDSDLDTAVGKARTTSASRGPLPLDVIESRARARREVEGRRWNVAPLLGYGTGDYNLGVGARAGYTFDSRVYLGGTFMFYTGADDIGVVPELGLTHDTTRFYYPAGEVGYDVGIGPVLLRPYGGVGVILARNATTTSGVEASQTQSSLLLYPGVAAHYIFPNSPFYLGGDVRALMPFERANGSFQLLGTGGLWL